MDRIIVRNNTVIASGLGAGGGVYAYLPSSLSAMTVRDSRVYGNTADGNGGGFYVDGTNLAHWSIERSEIYSNTAAAGGGIGNFMPLSLVDSSLHDNHATFDGGAIEAFLPLAISRTTLDANSAGRFGGGIFNLDMSSSANPYDFVNIAQSTLSGNSAQRGGGIYHDGFINFNGVLTLTNSTLSGNVVYRPSGATGSSDGGGLYVYGGQAQLFNVTIANNRVQLSFPNPQPGMGGGVYSPSTNTPPVSPSVLTFQNTIIANNTRGNGIMLPVADDCFTGSGTTGTIAFSLFTTMTNCSIIGPQGGNVIGQDPLLGPLQNNGGYTETHGLLTGSPAIDAGAQTGCTGAGGVSITIDQRGVGRPYNGRCDIGAYEVAAHVSQSIQFGPIADKILTNSPFIITATASSGLPVDFITNTPSVCSVTSGPLFDGVSSATVVLLGDGTCILAAQQAGNSTFDPAPAVAQTFQVTSKIFMPLILKN